MQEHVFKGLRYLSNGCLDQYLRLVNSGSIMTVAVSEVVSHQNGHSQYHHSPEDNEKGEAAYL